MWPLNLAQKMNSEHHYAVLLKSFAIRDLLKDLKIQYEEPIKVICDSRSAISIAHDPVYHNRMKHVNIGPSTSRRT